MINLYTGTPGSGKSLHVAIIIINLLKMGHNVIGTMCLNKDMLKEYKGKYIYCDIYTMQPKYFIAYARKYHKKGREGQCVLIIDECQRIFNARDWNVGDRRAWNDFFQVHRHFGFDIILVTQFDRLIDRQLRALVEYEFRHRKVGNFGFFGFLFSFLAGKNLHLSIKIWYPLKEKVGSEFFKYKKKYGDLYDSYMAFDEYTQADVNELTSYLVDDVGESGSRGPTSDNGSDKIEVVSAILEFESKTTIIQFGYMQFMSRGC